MQVTLFTKHSCQLCDALKYELLDLQAEYGFGFSEHFVDDVQGRSEEEKTHVPYVDMERSDGSTVRFDFPVKQAELRRAIRVEMGRQVGAGA